MSLFTRRVIKRDQFTDKSRTITVPRWETIIPLAILVSAVVMFVLFAAIKAFSRYQARSDASNRVRVTAINIRNAHQQVQVQNQLAQVRIAEARGIRGAQDEINKTLTPLYIQHEAIQAQERIATSGRNNTVVYVPAGTNGTPVITQDGDANSVGKLGAKP